MIPRIIHRIWLGVDLPQEAKELGDTWVRHCPGWEVRTWRDWDVPPLRNQELFDAADHLAQRADLARLEILLRYGGVYVDTDFEALAPIEPRLADVECFVAREDTRWIGTAIMGSTPDHPFIARLVREAPQSIAEHPGEPPNKQTGPWFVTAQLKAYRKASRGRAPVTVFPPALFYPYHFSEPERRDDHFPDALAVHHWSGTWRVDQDEESDPPSSSSDE